MRAMRSVAALLAVVSSRVDASNTRLRRKRGERKSNDEDAARRVENEIETRIIDGNQAKRGRYPYYTAIINESLGVWNSLLCGGTLIAEDVVLSAAHCTESGEADKVRVGAYGAPGHSNGGEPFHETSIVRRINHPKYNSNTLKYDVALYKLDRPVTDPYLLGSMMELDFTGKVDESLKADETLSAIGLGYVTNNGNMPDYLQQVDLGYLPNWKCRLRGWPYLSSDMLCAIDSKGNTDGKNQDSCSGDSGGPLVVTRDGQDIQVGIVSYGSTGGCGSWTPGVYARVSEVSGWIEDTICSLSPSSSKCPTPSYDPSEPQHQCSDQKDCSYIANKWKWVRAGLCLWDDIWKDGCDETCNRCD